MFDSFFPQTPQDGFLLSHAVGGTPNIVQRAFAERSQLSEADLEKILRCVEFALAIYASREGKLTAQEISLKSMLTVIRGQVVDQILSRSESVSSEFPNESRS